MNNNFGFGIIMSFLSSRIEKYRYDYIHILFFTLCILMPFSITYAATNYRSTEVQRLSEALNIPVDSLHEGFNIFNIAPLPVKVLYHADQVSFIGYDIFPEEVKEMAHTPILSFLERYFLQLSYPAPGRPREKMIKEDRFTFEVGNLSTILSLRPEDSFSYNYELRKYHITWTRNDQLLLSISFPAEHELISGETKIEADQNVESDILASTPVLPSSFLRSTLTPTVQGSYFIKKGKKYPKDQLTGDLYFKQQADTIAILFDSDHPLESAANLMLSPNVQGDFLLKFKQVMYGYKKHHFDAPLKQWIAYCIQSGCELFFGVEAYESDNIKASIIAVNEAEGYNHVLFVDIPISIIGSPSGEISATLETFIPMHNVMGLFAKFRENKIKQSKIYY